MHSSSAISKFMTDLVKDLVTCPTIKLSSRSKGEILQAPKYIKISRLTRNDLTIEGELENICTGLAKHENTIFFDKQPEQPKDWGYIALWGKQSLAGDDDELGMAVLYQDSQFVKLAEDDLNHVVILKPENNKVRYYFLAAWVQEPDGIRTQEAFVDYLIEIIQRVELPFIIQ